MKKNVRFLTIFKYFLMVAVIASIALGVFFLKNTATKAEANQSITDVNNDGVINLADARILTPPATISCPVCVDVNGDKKIDNMDLYLVRYHAGLEDPNEGSAYHYKPRLDVNNDGSLSQADADTVQSYIGKTVTTPAFGLDDPSELTFGYVANEVIVKFKNGASIQQKSPVFSKYNATEQKSLTFINADKIKVHTNNLENLQKQLKSESDVENVYKNHVGEWLTNDTFWQNQWGHKKINIEETWNTETKGSVNNPVRVGLIDSGVDIDNLDLLHNISWERRNWVPGEDMMTMSDESGHGTAMAGIIGATADNSTGIAGLNYDVDIVPVKVGQTGPSDYAVSIAFEWLMTRVKVINMSFGMGYINETNYLPNEYLRMAREDYGISIIAAAGEDARDDCQYPARHENVVCVAATDTQDAICSSSSGKVDADILAPGSNIITTVPAGHALDPDQDGIAIIPVCNTSVATAYISGVTALCRNVSFLPLSTEITRNDLKCKNMNHQGYGRIDAWSTLWWRNCHKYDFNDDLKIDFLELAAISFRYNRPDTYSTRYDIAPVGRDGKIDNYDALIILQRRNLSCPAW